MKWVYDGEEYLLPEECDPKELYGFVYLITNTQTGQMYVGKKFFWFKKTKPKTKTRKRRQRLLVESDWKTYYGSNKHLKSDVEKHGEDLFTREILHLCKTRGECAYLEAKEQFDRGVLLTDDYYNGIIQIKLGGNAIKTLYK